MRFKGGTKPLTSRTSIELHHGRWRLEILDPAGCGFSPDKAWEMVVVGYAGGSSGWSSGF